MSEENEPHNAGADELDVILNGSVVEAEFSPPEMDPSRFSTSNRGDSVPDAEQPPTPEKVPSKWGKSPTVKGQFTEKPGTWRLKPVVTENVKVSVGDCEGKRRMDELGRLSHLPAPSIKIFVEESHFLSGDFFILVKYAEIEYLQI